MISNIERDRLALLSSGEEMKAEGRVAVLAHEHELLGLSISGQDIRALEIIHGLVAPQLAYDDLPSSQKTILKFQYYASAINPKHLERDDLEKYKSLLDVYSSAPIQFQGLTRSSVMRHQMEVLGDSTSGFNPNFIGGHSYLGERKVRGRRGKMHTVYVSRATILKSGETEESAVEGIYTYPDRDLHGLVESAANQYSSMPDFDDEGNPDFRKEAYLQTILGAIVHPEVDANGRMLDAHLYIALKRRGIQIDINDIPNITAQIVPIGVGAVGVMLQTDTTPGIWPKHIRNFRSKESGGLLLSREEAGRQDIDYRFANTYQGTLCKRAEYVINQGIAPGAVLQAQIAVSTAILDSSINI